MPSEEIDFKLQQAKETFVLSQSSYAYLNDLEDKYNENYYLACDLVLRYFKKLQISPNFIMHCIVGAQRFVLSI